MCASICEAQQAASIDLTQIEARDELRRPAARPGDSTKRRGMIQPVNSCDPVPKDAPSVRTTLVWLDRNEHSQGDEVKFEVRFFNAGNVPLKIPFSPHLADLQPQDPSRKFAYSQMSVGLDITGTVGNTSYIATAGGGSVALYGHETHPETMLTLRPGEWAQIVGTTEMFVSDWPPVTHAKDAINRLDATVSIDQNETLLTSTDAATIERHICLNQTRGPSLPIKLQ